MIESRLLQQYRNASDEELLFLARQGPSNYVATAWALLQAEIVRRGLESPAAADAAKSHTKEDTDHERPQRHVARARFTGTGSEYFRIWVVNLLLTLLTLGVYSAWAKVRKARYFRQNTWLDGHVFDYHGRPAAILRGRLFGLVLLAAYTWAFDFSNTAGLVTAVILCLAGPWLFMRAQQFSLANTSFRGLRFGFAADARETYATLLPVLALWLAPSVAAAVRIDEGWLFGAPTLALPWMHHRLKAYQRRNATYGDRQFNFAPATLRFYAVYAKGLVLVLVGGILGAIAMHGVSRMLAALGVATISSTMETLLLGGTVGLFIYLVAGPYYAARLQQVLWAKTWLGDILFRTDIRARPLFAVVFKNVGLTVLTCGVYWPWAAVALARYRVGCMHVESDAPLSSLAAAVQAAAGSAAGEGTAEAFGLEIGM